MPVVLLMCVLNDIALDTHSLHHNQQSFLAVSSIAQHSVGMVEPTTADRFSAFAEDQRNRVNEVLQVGVLERTACQLNDCR